MTTTLTALSPLLSSAAPPVKPADSGPGIVDGDGTAFARELSRAQDAGPPATPAAKAGKPALRSRASPDRADAPPSGSEAVAPHRGGEPGKTETDEADTNADTGAQQALPADLASMINSLLGLPGAPASAPTALPVDAAAAAGAAAVGAALADSTAPTATGQGKNAAADAARPWPGSLGAGADVRSGGASDADGGARRAASVEGSTPSTVALQAPAADLRATPPGDGLAPLQPVQDTPSRQITEPLPLPTAALPAAAAGAGPTAGAPTAGAAATAFEARLSAALGSLDFAPALGQQIRVLVQDGVQHARLHLNPAEMGPITVQIALDGLAAQVHLAAEQPLTRQALEQAMPVLASTLREGGLTLSGGGVFEQPRDPQREGSGGPSGGTRRDDARSDVGGRGTLAEAAPRRLRGAVDLVA
jgi:flagellar hook-length control protein FliK